MCSCDITLETQRDSYFDGIMTCQITLLSKWIGWFVGLVSEKIKNRKKKTGWEKKLNYHRFLHFTFLQSTCGASMYS